MLALRVQKDAAIDAVDDGQTVDHHGVRVSLHPAGHVLGSAQVRLEHRGEVVVITGDYKLDADPTCSPFEPVRCHTLITEATFGLPIFRWPSPDSVFAEINQWWRDNQAAGRTSVLYGYALGKAQRLLAGLDPSVGPILLHGAVSAMCELYRRSPVVGAASLPGEYASAELAKQTRGEAIVVAPPSAGGSGWLRRFGPVSEAFASGWMAIRGNRRRRSIDRGFVISDHVDWPALNRAVELSGAQRIGVTHGYTDATARWFAERGHDTFIVPTRWLGESEVDDNTPADDDGAAA